MRRGVRCPAVLLTAILAMAVSALGADWPQFRGPSASGVGEDCDLPVQWGEPENVAWKAELPGRGVSSPIVVGGRVFVTANSGYRKDRLHVLCLDARRGTRLWERQFWSTGRTACHPKTCMAAPTPASDGERVFAFFATNDLFCLDLDGNLLWLRGLTADYPNATSGTGMAASPLWVAGVLVVQVENQSHSFAAGIDPKTGRNLWKIPRSPLPSWSTPVTLPGRDGSVETVVLESWDRVSGHDPRTGEELWGYRENQNCIPSCAVFEDRVLVPAGGLTALRPVAGSESPEVVWRSSKLRPGTSSPVVHEGRVYTLSSAGILTCASATDGEVSWQLRLKGPFSSTPVVSGDCLYSINESGLAQVVRLGESAELVGSTELGETLLATPAIAEGGLFVRSDRWLWKIAKPAAAVEGPRPSSGRP